MKFNEMYNKNQEKYKYIEEMVKDFENNNLL